MKKVFTAEISTVVGSLVLCVLGISASAFIMSSSLGTSLFFAGVQTVSADLEMPPITVAHQPYDEKQILVSLSDQTLTYMEGNQVIGHFLISSGVRGMPSPVGEFTVLKKKPVVDYTGPTYSFPNTKWNLMFKVGKPLNYYIHGAYWHHNFGHRMSHGCINVAYADMEGLYNWADVGTKITIQN